MEFKIPPPKPHINYFNVNKKKTFSKNNINNHNHFFFYHFLTPNKMKNFHFFHPPKIFIKILNDIFTFTKKIHQKFSPKIFIKILNDIFTFI